MDLFEIKENLCMECQNACNVIREYQIIQIFIGKIIHDLRSINECLQNFALFLIQLLIF
jgi:hypothetical protein